MAKPTLLVIVPTRGRPHSVRPFVEAWLVSNPPDSAELVFAVDDDDQMLGAYRAVMEEITSQHKRIGLVEGPASRMVGVLNRVATQNAERFDALAFLGDDHRFDGPWAPILSALNEAPAIVYGDDGYQHEKMATAVFMTSDIVRTLGYMAPSSLLHLKADQVWVSWGEAIGRLHYLEEVSIPHLHPFAGKSEWDERYEAVNDSVTEEADRRAYEEYLHDGAFEVDVRSLERLL